MKRGQFFLIAALIIVIIIISLGVVYNYSFAKEEKTKVFDLSKEITYETSRVQDSGVFNLLPEESVDEHVRELSIIYAENNPDKEFLIIYGDTEKYFTLDFKREEQGSLCISLAGSLICQNIDEFVFNEDSGMTSPDGTVVVTIDEGRGIQETFDLRSGQNFFVIVSQDLGDEVYVSDA